MKGVYEMTEDSGWKTLPLATGIIAYSDAQTPQYRKIGPVVYLRGAVKGITTLSKIIGTLPEGFRPSKAKAYVQNTSAQDSYPHFTRVLAQADGDIEIQYSTNDISATTWFRIDTEFLVD